MSLLRSIGLLLALSAAQPGALYADAAPDYQPTRRTARHVDLIQACIDGDLNEVRALVRRGADPAWTVPDRYESANRGPAVVKAAQNGHADILRYLLDQRPDLMGNHGAEMMDKAIEQLTGQKDPKDKDPKAQQRYLQVVKLLHERKPPELTLSWARGFDYREGTVEALKLLLDTGLWTLAEPETEIALREAADRGRVDLLRELVRRGARFSNPSKPQQTALYRAVSSRQTAAVKFLIENKADVNYPDAEGTTPLILAAEQGSVDIVRLLLAAGADPKAKDKKGETAMSRLRASYVMESQGPQIVKLLEQASGAPKTAPSPEKK